MGSTLLILWIGLIILLQNFYTIFRKQESMWKSQHKLLLQIPIKAQRNSLQVHWSFQRLSKNPGNAKRDFERRRIFALFDGGDRLPRHADAIAKVRATSRPKL